MSYRTDAAEEHTACVECAYRTGTLCDAAPLAKWDPVLGWLLPSCAEVRRLHPIACPHHRERPRCTAEQHLGPIRVGLVLRRRFCAACGESV